MFSICICLAVSRTRSEGADAATTGNPDVTRTISIELCTSLNCHHMGRNSGDVVCCLLACTEIAEALVTVTSRDLPVFDAQRNPCGTSCCDCTVQCHHTECESVDYLDCRIATSRAIADCEELQTEEREVA